MISGPDRREAVRLIDEAKQNGAREHKACEILNISVRTLQRWRQNVEDQRPYAMRPVPKNKLTDKEIQQVLSTVNKPAFQSLPPSQIIPALADQGIYIASESTFYRILRQHRMNHHRGRSQKPVKKPITTHYATGPNQVWMWDITWLPGPAKGLFFYLYMIIDLYSRKIIAWEIHSEESAVYASHLVRKAALSENLSQQKQPTVLHSDNGSPMKGATLLETLYTLKITPSRSRPRVSNDNPYAESIFRTYKYRPGFPAKGFSNLQKAREWTYRFSKWYNHEHKHSGIQFVSPNERHTGQAQAILSKRKETYEKAKAKHPERWAGKTRDWRLPEKVWLNPVKAEEGKDVKSS